MKISLWGFGFVNRAVAHGFGNDNEILFYDNNPKVGSNCTKQEMMSADFIFLGLPTPMKKNNGEIDLSIIDSVLKEISELKYTGIIIIKSTIIPGSTDKFRQKYPNLRIVFNPEFLTERSANLDFINACRIVLGGDKKDVDEVEKLYRTRFIHTPIIKTDTKTAEFIKYMANVFFATKVIYMNTLYKASQKFGINWDDAIKGLLSDQRIGNSHYQVPGHDGDLGFGGKCFPKDLNAYIGWLKANDLNDEAEFFNIIWKLNLKYRTKRDWEKIEGAVS